MSSFGPPPPPVLASSPPSSSPSPFSTQKQKQKKIDKLQIIKASIEMRPTIVVHRKTMNTHAIANFIVRVSLPSIKCYICQMGQLPDLEVLKVVP
jgi:hypothetical protein